LKIKNILISQPQPENEKSPYADIANKFNVDICFRKFIKIESIEAKEFRQQRINILDYTAIIFTSKQSIDTFFILCEDLRVQIPETMKYFCTSEAIALYLQKYVQFRKRKIFYGKSNLLELLDIIKKQKTEKYLFPCSENHQKDFPQLLEQSKADFSIAPIYRTIPDDLSDVDISKYQMLVFYSPIGIESLKKNFPDFVQNETVIGAFGEATARAVEKEGFTLNLKAPSESAPSMTSAIESFLENNRKKKC
jgi:uroporphyrinogen-III synthase